MARLLADENFPLPAVELLRALGHDVETARDAGIANQETPDDQVLSYATAQARAVLTLNRHHFIRLHRRVADHAGVIVCTRDENFDNLAHRIHQAITHASDLRGRILRINRPQQAHPPATARQ